MKTFTLTLTLSETELDVIYDALVEFRAANAENLEVCGVVYDVVDKLYEAQEDAGPRWQEGEKQC